jgi:hypothetical protein
MSECRGRKDHEGKTSGSVLHGLVFAHECALLVNFRIHDMKKILVDALGTLSDKGIAFKAYFLSTPGARELGPSIDVIEIRDDIIYRYCNMY